MKIKQILLLVFYCTSVFSAAHSQSAKNDSDYRKFLISIGAGLDYTMGASGTVLPIPFDDNFTVPSASKGFGAGLDVAYFLTKNYGVGLKYRFFTVNSKQSYEFEYADVEDKYYYPVWVLEASSFKEQTYAFGPSVYARWLLGQSRWRVSANAGIVYLYNKLPSIEGKKEYYLHSEDMGNFLRDRSMQWVTIAFADGNYTGSTVGFTLSGGVQYRLSSSIGIGISVDGLFASLSRMKYLNYFDEYETVDITRKINRVGISAGIDYYF